MLDDCPEPPVAPEVDLRDFPYMPLDVLRLRDSDLASTASDGAFRAAVLLWCAAWHQIPAASLPNDERILARLAGFGRDIRGYRKISSAAQHGFVQCTDGRLYHAVIVEKANEAWAAKQRQRDRTKAATRSRIRKEPQRNDDRNGARDEDRNDQRDDQHSAQRDVQRNDDRNVHQGKEREIGIGKDKHPPVLRTVHPSLPNPRDRTQRGSRIPEDWQPRAEDLEWALTEFSLPQPRALQITAEFVDFWLSATGKNACHASWWRTWRNRIRQLHDLNRLLPNGSAKPKAKLTQASWDAMSDAERGEYLPGYIRPI